MCVTKRVSAKMRLQIKQTTYSILARVMFITFAYVYRLNLGYFSGTLEKSAPGEIIPKLVGPCYVYHSGEIVPWRPFLWLQNAMEYCKGTTTL